VIKSDEQTSTSLPKIVSKISKDYHINDLYYVKGPGSFMAIKVAYIFLKSFAICNNSKLFGADGFIFNNNTPIKAIGTRYFMKENGKISLVHLEGTLEDRFELPNILDHQVFDSDSEPLYILPAV